MLEGTSKEERDLELFSISFDFLVVRVIFFFFKFFRLMFFIVFVILFS